MKTIGQILGYSLGAIAFIAVIIGVMAALTPKAVPIPLIKARTAMVGSELMVTNTSDQDYTDCFVQVNAGGTTYYIKDVNIAARSLVSLNVRHFHSISDVYYDGRHVVRDNNITCNTATGKVDGGRTFE